MCALIFLLSLLMIWLFIRPQLYYHIFLVIFLNTIFNSTPYNFLNKQSFKIQLVHTNISKISWKSWAVWSHDRSEPQREITKSLRKYLKGFRWDKHLCVGEIWPIRSYDVVGEGEELEDPWKMILRGIEGTWTWIIWEV